MSRSRLHHRKDRIQEEIKKEIADILHREVKDPRIGFISITDVEISDDLSYVKVFYSSLNEDKLDEIQEGLDKATGYIRSEIGKRIRLRLVPELSFRYDASLKRGAHIDRLLEEALKKGASGDESSE
ncbi:MAG: 30S ribosome-binding factor RbfA [Bacillota bacterium]|jgi:ribosome-binding factor A|nr:30S ribosome-binding factor RbfA [Bacillota bacterium]NLU54094.1 30S ribosome-binding factor RbfA [Bacillota bacterium]HOA92013.1 30S ribosome-binding factor RbfA [Bacillota bacterium]HOL12900.1 30S ribosome-binding factor RbfA [Bacillota bacterium]HOP54383.1 30S ribosome-binding factor RbfA [Bacillota bacterium]